MDYLIAALLGVIEGITEFLPIASTGHLLIAEHWLGHQSDLFNIVIQAGAIVAVTLIYRQRVWTLLTGLADRETRNYALKLALAFVITAALGMVVTKLGFKLPETVSPVAWRSEEHTSELQSLMRISYAVFCLKKKHSKRQSGKHQDHGQRTHIMNTRTTNLPQNKMQDR